MFNYVSYDSNFFSKFCNCVTHINKFGNRYRRLKMLVSREQKYTKPCKVGFMTSAETKLN